MISSLSKFALSTGAAVGALLALANTASAFSFTTNFTGNSPKGDIFLESIQIGSTIIDKSVLSYVSAANIVYNDPYTGGNSGAASADIGDNATTGVKVEDPSNGDIVTNLGNNNLNNIIDGEDKGSFVIDLTFSKAFNNLFFWERGMNSRLGVQFLDDLGNVIAGTVLDSSTWDYAGYSIDTKEITGAQKVGSYGLNLADLGISGRATTVRLYSEKAFNGPDFKVVGATVPEPGTVIGLSALAGAFFVSRRRKADA